jgi:hypothetical protein
MCPRLRSRGGRPSSCPRHRQLRDHSPALRVRWAPAHVVGRRAQDEMRQFLAWRRAVPGFSARLPSPLTCASPPSRAPVTRLGAKPPTGWPDRPGHSLPQGEARARLPAPTGHFTPGFGAADAVQWGRTPVLSSRSWRAGTGSYGDRSPAACLLGPVRGPGGFVVYAASPVVSGSSVFFLGCRRGGASIRDAAEDPARAHTCAADSRQQPRISGRSASRAPRPAPYRRTL